MSESVRVLDPADRDLHGLGGGLHPPLRFLAPCPAAAPNRSPSTNPTAWPRPAPALGLKHVVITSVTRDDLPDGADHFRRCILAVRERTGATIEVLVPDFDGRTDAIDIVLSANPEVFNHNEACIYTINSSVLTYNILYVLLALFNTLNCFIRQNRFNRTPCYCNRGSHSKMVRSIIKFCIVISNLAKVKGIILICGTWIKRNYFDYVRDEYWN